MYSFQMSFDSRINQKKAELAAKANEQARIAESARQTKQHEDNMLEKLRDELRATPRGQSLLEWTHHPDLLSALSKIQQHFEGLEWTRTSQQFTWIERRTKTPPVYSYRTRRGLLFFDEPYEQVGLQDRVLRQTIGKPLTPDLADRLITGSYLAQEREDNVQWQTIELVFYGHPASPQIRSTRRDYDGRSFASFDELLDSIAEYLVTGNSSLIYGDVDNTPVFGW